MKTKQKNSLMKMLGISEEDILENPEILEDLEDLSSRDIKNIYQCSNLFMTIARNILNYENSDKEDFDTICALSDRLTNMYSQMVPKYCDAQKYIHYRPEELDSLPEIENSLNFLNLMFSVDFAGTESSDDESACYSNRMLPAIIAEAMIKSAVKTNRLDRLKEGIEQCRKIVFPDHFPDLSKLKYPRSQEYFYPQTDVISRQDYMDLSEIVLLCAEDSFYEMINKTYPADIQNRRNRLREKKRGLWNQISLTLSSKVKKNATAMFYESVGYVLEAFIKEAKEFNNHSSSSKCETQSETAISDSHSRTHAFEFDRLKKYIVEILNSFCQTFYTEHLACEPEMVLLGCYLAIMKEPLWLNTIPASVVLQRCYIYSSHCMKLDLELGYDQITEETTNTITGADDEGFPAFTCLLHAFSMLCPKSAKKIFSKLFPDLDPDLEDFSDAFAVLGIKFINGEPNIPNAEETFLKLLTISKNLYQNLNLDHLDEKRKDIWLGNYTGIITTVYLLLQAGLLHPEYETETPDYSEYVERAIQAEEALKTKERQLEAESNALQSERQRLKELQKQLNKAEREVRVSQKKIAELTSEKDNLQKQADDLLDTVNAISETQEEDTEETDNGIELPASLNQHNIISYGGFPTFITKLHEFLPDLDIYETDRRPSDATIKKAEAVFVQINCIPHSAYWYILGICRANHIPFFRYKTSSARKAAEQVLKEIEKM